MGFKDRVIVFLLVVVRYFLGLLGGSPFSFGLLGWSVVVDGHGGDNSDAARTDGFECNTILAW